MNYQEQLLEALENFFILWKQLILEMFRTFTKTKQLLSWHLKNLKY